jgi:molybdopterin-guanine dinucleotide biosynthesis protein A
MTMIDDCTGLVLAGGHSRRMGRDKTVLEFNGQTLLQRTVALLQTIFPSVLVSVQRLRQDVAVPQVLDEYPDAGPLAGLCAGLAKVDTPWVFAVAADMPFLLPQVIQRLSVSREGVQAVVPVIQGCLQPLAAYYATSALPELQGILAMPGKHSLRGALERLAVCRVHDSRLQGVDPSLRSFLDLDTPEDIEAAKGHE